MEAEEDGTGTAPKQRLNPGRREEGGRQNYSFPFGLSHMEPTTQLNPVMLATEVSHHSHCRADLP